MAGMKYTKQVPSIGAVSQPVRIAMLAVLAMAIVLVFSDGTPRAAGVFAPTVSIETSTTQATAHPDARITVDNSASDENIKSIKLSLPDGMWGSLASVAAKCPWADANPVDQTVPGTCSAGSKVGTVVVDAKVDNSDARLRGTVFMTEPDPVNATTDPAALVIEVHAQVGGVDLGYIRTPARVGVRYAALPVSVPTSNAARGRALGIDTNVESVPQSITDEHGRTVDFRVQKIQVDLKSDQQSPQKPLLTNPTKCSTAQLTSSIDSYELTPTTVTPSDDYTTTGCSNLRLAPATVDYTLSDHNADAVTGLQAEIEFPDNSPSLSEMIVSLSPGMAANMGAFGAPGDMCKATTLPDIASNPNLEQYFRRVSSPSSSNFYCPPSAEIGSAQIESPLVDTTLTGKIYVVNISPLPYFVIDVDRSYDTVNNPPGVKISLVGKATPTGTFIPGCGSCQSSFTATQMTFSQLPDAPISKVTIDLNKPDRAKTVAPAGMLSSKPITMPSSSNPKCVPSTEIVTSMTSHGGSGLDWHGVDPQAVIGCDQDFDTIEDAPLLTSGPLGAVTSSTSPSFGYTASPDAICKIDTVVAVAPGPADCPTGTGTIQPASALSAGPHVVNVYTNDTTSDPPNVYPIQSDYHAFVVRPTQTTDTTPPTTSIDTAPDDPTSDTTPTTTFSSDDSNSTFECSLNSGPFLPCDPNASPAGTGSYTVADEDALIPGDSTYTIAVRARDDFGNVDLTPASTSFKVDVAFAPTLDVDITSTQARAHPDLDVTIANLSHEDLDELELKLPDGFLGGLTGVQSLCPLATAAAGNCTVASEVGTVDASALVDESLVRLPGTVYLTDPIEIGDPAGLSVKVPAVLQDVDMGDVIVPVRLKVRGQVKGIDSVAVDIPNSITPTNGYDTVTEFDMREMKLKLRTGSGATYPLLTNPSSCAATAFDASFVGADSTTASDSVNFQPTGCDSLGFAPSLSLSIVDSTTGGPPGPNSAEKPISANLKATLSADPAGAGIRGARVLMPKPVSINVLKIPFACTVEQKQIDACPETAVVGSVSAISPLLPEALTGKIYLLRGATAGVPNLFLRLRGRINVDIVATNRFVNDTQLESTFTDLPDVPLSSFTMNVNEFLSTRNEACEYPPSTWFATGSLTAHNDKSVPVSNGLDFDCAKAWKATASAKFKNRGSKSTMSLDVRPGAGAKLKQVTITTPKGVTFVRKAISKKTTGKSGNSKLAAKCFKAKRANTILVAFCKKPATRLQLSFKPGAVKASKKVKRPKIKIVVIDDSNRKTTITVKTR